MENKNEKTFSDLFLNAKDEVEKSEDKFTFDALSNEISDSLEEEKVEDAISFSSFSDIAKDNLEFDSLNNSENDNLIDEDTSKVKSSSIFDIALEDVEEEADEDLIDEKVISDDTNVIDSIFDYDKNLESNFVGDEVDNDDYVVSEEKIDAVINEEDSVSEDVVDGEKNEEEKVTSDMFGMGVTQEEESVSEDVVDEKENEKEKISSNIFGMGTTSEEDSVSENVADEEENEKEKVTSDIFGMGATSEEDSVSENAAGEEENKEEKITSDVFGMGVTDSDVDSLSSSVDSGVNLNDKATESTSPFFESSAELSDDNVNPLFSNTISLEESNNIQKEVGKLNLSNTKHFDVKVVPKKEPLTKFIFGVISYAFFIWLLLIGITLLVYVLDIKIRAAKGDTSSPVFNAYVVLTGSMLPDIQVNDVVITKKVDAEELEVGDIITFVSADSRFNNAIITHRIIKKNPANKASGITFQTKGDNNNVADSALVPEANVFGKVILKIPKLGYLQEFLASQGGWIIVILIPCLTVISYDIVKIAKGVKKKKYNNIKVKK